MAKYLITPSLYGSYLWYHDTDFNNMYDDTERAEQAEKQAYQDFLNCLNKIKTPTTEAQQKGIDFETMVYELTDGLEPCGDEVEAQGAREVADIIGKGGVWQQVLMKETDKYLLYGRSDYINRDTIYDIKRTSSYEEGKFLKSIQHQIYFAGADSLEHFKYVIAAGKSTPSIFVEYYHKEPNNLENLLGKVDLMVDFIKSVPEFNKAFNENWIARGEN